MATPTIGTFRGFPPEAFTFYAELEENNSKAWFDEHRDVYERAVRLPLEELLDAAADEFGSDGKVFRPNRDVRFSKDKSPYKTHAGAVIADGYDDRPVFYAQVNATGLIAASGYYRMSRDQLDRYLRAVDDDRRGDELVAILDALRGDGFEVNGSVLKTAPRGYDRDHPRVELLRHKSMAVSIAWPVRTWMHTPAAWTRVAETWRKTADLGSWLQQHVGAAAEEPEGRPR